MTGFLLEFSTGARGQN